MSDHYGAEASLHFMPSGDLLFEDHESHKNKFLRVDTVMAAFSAFGQDTGWMPAGLVRHGNGANGPWYVYSAPGQKVSLQVDGEIIVVPMPRTVVFHQAKEVYVWAQAVQHFEPKAEACRVPTPNVYDGGRVCWGQSRPPDAVVTKARETWVKFFTGTAFNRDLANGKSKAYPQNVIEQLRALARKRKYPTDDLVGMGKTIEEAIKELMK
jgi:hypothetical protein